MDWYKIVICIIVSILMIILDIKGQDYPVTDRSPAYATSYIMKPGEVMIESGYYAVNGLRNLLESNLNGFNIQTRIGVSPSTEIRVGMGFVHLHPDPLINFSSVDLSGLNAIKVSLKTSLAKESDHLPAIAMVFNLELPEPGNDFYTPSSLSPSFKIVVEKFLNKTFILGTNLGFLWRDNIEETFTYSISLRTALSNKFSLYSEFYGQNSSLISSYNFVDWALEFWAWKDVVLDITFGLGISDSSDDNFISIGGACRID